MPQAVRRDEGRLGVWGKVIGGLAGFVTGGPFGAVVGAALGHAADTATGSRGPALPPNAASLAALLGSKEQLFAIGVVVLSAKLAKCDGPVTRPEIDAFKRMFRIPPENLREVGRLFDSARESPEGHAAFARQLGEAFADNKAMLEDVLAALFHIARADGALTRAEVTFLQDVQVAFGLDAAAWERARDGRSAGSAPAPTGPDPYAVLGVARDAPDDAVRQAWRQLMRENHPDSLASRGVPADFVRRATDKVAEINAAWDRIKRERKL
jgi:DnaJ like chaperone protein